MNQSENQNSVLNENKQRKWSVWQSLLQAVVLLFFIAAGWFLRGAMPGGNAAGGPPAGRPATLPTVNVETVQEGLVEAPKEYIGHVEAIQEVDLFAQVTGTIETVHFAEGSYVNEGDLLFTIQQDEYKARVALAEASYQQAQANLNGATADLEAERANLDAAAANQERAEKYLKRLQSADERSVVQANLDTAVSDEKQAKSMVRQARARIDQAKTAVQQMEALVHKAKADLDLALIDLGYTEIRSPLTGRIGEAVVTKGNYVGPSTGALARIVQMDPIRVVWSLTDREYLSLLEKTETGQEPSVKIRLRLPNGHMFDGAGSRDFEDNVMDPQTGTIAVYTRYDNDNGLLIPHSFVTVIMEPVDGKKAPLIPQEAILFDSEGHFVYVVDENSIVEQRRVEPGEIIKDDQIILSGLKAGERIVVQGIQKAQNGQKVMISSNASEGGE